MFASEVSCGGESRASLREMVAKTQFAITGEDTRYFLNGALFVLRPTEMSLVATDGHRLALVTTARDGKAKKDEGEGKVSWWASFARSSAVDMIGGRDVPRSWDQPNAASFSVNYHRSATWNFNVAGLYHSGWPTTPLNASVVGSTIEPVLGERNAARLSAFSRLDTRISRSTTFSHGTFRSWIEVTNLLNHHNVCCVQDFSFVVNQGQRTVDVRESNTGVGRLPSFGVAWEF